MNKLVNKDGFVLPAPERNLPSSERNKGIVKSSMELDGFTSTREKDGSNILHSNIAILTFLAQTLQAMKNGKGVIGNFPSGSAKLTKDSKEGHALSAREESGSSALYAKEHGVVEVLLTSEGNVQKIGRGLRGTLQTDIHKVTAENGLFKSELSGTTQDPGPSCALEAANAKIVRLQVANEYTSTTKLLHFQHVSTARASTYTKQAFRILDLSGNSFIGLIPESLSNLEYLEQAWWGGVLHDLREFNISSNLLSGKIPEIGNLKVASLIDLSKNNFYGKIPSTLGGLDKLIKLSQAHNRLDGPIPNSFGKMLALEFLYLCYNNLSGEIPKLLDALVYLKYLNISFNELNGEIPMVGPFANATAITYVFVRLQKTKKNTGQTDVSLVKEHERISYYELEYGIEVFDESNLLGNGSFRRVYKGILKDGTLFAAKVLNVQLEGGFKSFDTECEILRNLHHRNLTKVITSCSNHDFKALVLEYMPNRTLDKSLYSHNLFLNLLQTLDIMIDVASTVDYLHNCYLTPVVHCDLKPSNVLLDQEMVGHVSDFGIAKLLGKGEGFVQTRTIATIGYIAPKYGQDGIVSMSCDVYSFGILMMEMFTRMRPSDEIFTGDFSIQRWVGDSFPSEIHKVLDSNVVQPEDEQVDAKIQMQCLLSIMELALSCTLVRPNASTSIEDALSTLKKIRLQFVSNRY
ncbi:receptor kinase-like protein Xa21 [Lycium barbarum]|uniref:receptor kinase-like protein Xa21 n=1 Tax=Lycium barbarum TaxID=112863 RepID=UPI00293F2204|nr:receptor kinase-like protein Xa21 [Lycium barbarum]